MVWSSTIDIPHASSVARIERQESSSVRSDPTHPAASRPTSPRNPGLPVLRSIVRKSGKPDLRRGEGEHGAGAEKSATGGDRGPPATTESKKRSHQNTRKKTRL